MTTAVRFAALVMLAGWFSGFQTILCAALLVLALKFQPQEIDMQMILNAAIGSAAGLMLLATILATRGGLR